MCHQQFIDKKYENIPTAPLTAQYENIPTAPLTAQFQFLWISLFVTMMKFLHAMK